MKFIHLSDLHLGKRVNEFPMIDDQKYILTKIINVIDDEKPDGVIIAGDVYDKPTPPTEAVELFDDFLVRLAKRKLQVFVISGNHDSAERLSFANRLIDLSGIHISNAYNGEVKPYEMEDELGKVYIYLLPFIKPSNVKRFYPEEEINSYTDAVRVAINNMEIDPSQRNVIVTHQFVTGATRSESEEISVGGTDNVDASVFEFFDYVALGHIHGPQKIESEKIRYCGTPLKYSFSEKDHEKSVTVVELGLKDELAIRTVKLVPNRDMVEIRGKYDELMLKSFYENTSYDEDYMHIVLTDEDDVPEVMNKMRQVYHNIMKLDYDNQRTRHTGQLVLSDDMDKKSPQELFADFYSMQNGVEMTKEQTDFVNALIASIWEGENV